MAAVATLERIEATPYPAKLLPHGGTGLCLFAAAFLGANDAVHMARAGMAVHCVDTDGARLAEMRALYVADDWMWFAMDAWTYAEHARESWGMYDVVSVDSWTGDIEPRVMASLPLWCSLARRLVTVTIGAWNEAPAIPDGWTATRMHRSPSADWLVLQRA